MLIKNIKSLTRKQYFMGKAQKNHIFQTNMLLGSQATTRLHTNFNINFSYLKNTMQLVSSVIVEEQR